MVWNSDPGISFLRVQQKVNPQLVYAPFLECFLFVGGFFPVKDEKWENMWP